MRKRRKPSCIRRCPRHVAVEVRRAVAPPNSSALTQGMFGDIDRRVSLGVFVARSTGQPDSPASCRELGH
jgi:hypothetical protein